MSVVAYFEDGPMRGKTVAIDTPTTTYIVMSPQQQQQAYYQAMGDPMPVDLSLNVDKIVYHLEVIPHRDGCVTYFDSEASRDRAWVEDSLDADSPTGMIESCPPPRIIEAYMRHSSQQRGLAFHDEVSRRMLESPLAPIGAG